MSGTHSYKFLKGDFIMKNMLMAVMAVAVAVTFSAPAFAGEKKEEKKGGHVVISAEEKKDKGGKADETFGDKKEEKKGGHADTFGDDKKDKGGK
jgi:hypothetical protein